MASRKQCKFFFFQTFKTLWPNYSDIKTFSSFCKYVWKLQQQKLLQTPQSSLIGCCCTLCRIISLSDLNESNWLKKLSQGSVHQTFIEISSSDSIIDSKSFVIAINLPSHGDYAQQVTMTKLWSLRLSLISFSD